MKKTILSLVLIFSSIALFAQSEEEILNKWINTYNELSTSKNWDGMISNFDQCHQEVPNWDFAYYYKGFAEFNKQNYENAIKDLSTFASKTDTLNVVNMMIAQSYNNLNQPENALAALDKFLAKEPNSVAGYQEKANAHMQMKDYANYISDLQKVAELEPNNESAYANIASAYGLQQNFQGVIDNLTKAIAINPNQAQYYQDRAFANYSLKTPENIQAALVDYDKAEELGVKDAALYNRKYVCHSMLKDYQGALDDCNKLLAIDPEDLNNIYYRGDANYKLKNYKEAIPDLDKVIASDKVQKTRKIQALQRRGASKQALKDLKGAQADAAMIKQLQGK